MIIFYYGICPLLYRLHPGEASVPPFYSTVILPILDSEDVAKVSRENEHSNENAAIEKVGKKIQVAYKKI